MLKLIRPDFQTSSLDAIPVELLMERGIRGLMIDLDNTMTPWNDMEVEPKVTQWFNKIGKAGIKACILSNNRRKQRVEVIAEKLGIPFVYKANKPRRRAYQSGFAIIKTKLEETAVIGDQLFTDILGGNRAGLFTILVLPINKHEFIGTKCIRYVEKLMLWLMNFPREMSPRIR